MGERVVKNITPTELQNVVASVIGTDVVSVAKYQDIAIQAAGFTSPDMTVKVRGSSSVERPDMQSAISSSNFWSHIAMVDTATPGTILDGATGLVFGAAADESHELLVNVETLNWICIEVIWTAGNGYFKYIVADND